MKKLVTVVNYFFKVIYQTLLSYNFLIIYQLYTFSITLTTVMLI